MKETLAASVRRGDALALARAITLVEDGIPAGESLLAELFPVTGKATVIGVTGPPGAGKSTLVNRLVAHFRRGGKSVGVIAVDPTSAFSGGAILGDRIRMLEHALDPGVFIRSMASRGQFGGLSRATCDALDLVDASGRDPILIETVGVGQDEVEVARVADTVLVVLTPGQGDDIQAIKAGLLEIADVLVINKVDHPGVERLASDLEGVLALGEARGWTPPIVRTTAHDGGGVDDLVAAIERHAAWLTERGARATRRREGLRARFLAILRERILSRLVSDGLGESDLGSFEKRLEAREIDPYTAARAVLDRRTTGVELDHVGIAVRSVEERSALYRDLLGLPHAGTEEVPGEGVRVAFLKAGRTRIELVEPTRGDGAMARHLERRGEGVHHLCFEVSDLEGALERLERAGLQLAGPPAREGAEGSRVAFLHPRGTGGVLIELRARDGKGPGRRPA